MSIKVGNIRTHKNDGSIAIKVDRSSVLGKSFYVADESKRDSVCDRYEVYFNDKIKYGIDGAFIRELSIIFEVAKTHDVTLLCWCAPKRCHAETIIRYIESVLAIYHKEMGV